MTSHHPNLFIARLTSAGPAPDRADKLDLYGRFVGDWSMEARVVTADGTSHSGRGEIHFAWVLEGRAVQDVWILPGFFFGTTLRVYDPGQDAWHILWSDPLKQLYLQQLGRAEGDDIVQEGDGPDGSRTRWSFRDITPDSFTWRGEISRGAGTTWALQVEFKARRTIRPDSGGQ